MYVKSRPDYHKLNNYNSQPKGTVQGPTLPASIPKMETQHVLYPQVNHKYNALTFDGNDNAYYKIDTGPYKQKCSQMHKRDCHGGPPERANLQQKSRENYNSESRPLGSGDSQVYKFDPHYHPWHPHKHPTKKVGCAAGGGHGCFSSASYGEPCCTNPDCCVVGTCQASPPGSKTGYCEPTSGLGSAL